MQTHVRLLFGKPSKSRHLRFAQCPNRAVSICQGDGLSDVCDSDFEPVHQHLPPVMVLLRGLLGLHSGQDHSAATHQTLGQLGEASSQEYDLSIPLWSYCAYVSLAWEKYYVGKRHMFVPLWNLQHMHER